MIKKAIIAGLLSGITITSALAVDNLNVNVPNVRAIMPPPPKPGTLVYQNDMDISHASFLLKMPKDISKLSQMLSLIRQKLLRKHLDIQ